MPRHALSKKLLLRQVLVEHLHGNTFVGVLTSLLYTACSTQLCTVALSQCCCIAFCVSKLTSTECVLQALLCVAKEDPDTVWMVLHLLLGSQHLNGMTNPGAELFPDASKLLQTQETVNPLGDVADLRLSVSGLLQKVETIQASWHSHCAD